MDWPKSTEPILTVFPQGMKRDGGRVVGEIIEKENSAVWTSKYGSMLVTLYGLETADRFNEKGLGVLLLYLNATDFGKRDKKRPGMQAGLWGRYLLDNAANVEEALKLMEKIQIIMVDAHGHKATCIWPSSMPAVIRP